MVDLTDLDGGKLEGFPASIVATSVIRSLCGFFLLILHKDNNPSNISDYGNPTLAEYQAINNLTYEAYLTVSILFSLDR